MDLSGMGVGVACDEKDSIYVCEREGCHPTAGTFMMELFVDGHPMRKIGLSSTLTALEPPGRIKRS